MSFGRTQAQVLEERRRLSLFLSLSLSLSISPPLSSLAPADVLSPDLKPNAAQNMHISCGNPHTHPQEFEAEEEASRIEARERDARLEAEKERLSKESGKPVPDAGNKAGAAADGAGGNVDGSGWTADSWILSGVTGAEVRRVAAQNARRTGNGAPARKPAFVKNEKTSEKAAAVAKLLAGTAAANGGGGGGDGDGDDDGDGDVGGGCDTAGQDVSAAGGDDEARGEGASEERAFAAATVVPAGAGEEGDGSPPAKGVTANGGGEVVGGDGDGDTCVSSAVSAMEVEDEKSSAPSPLDDSVDSAAETAEGAQTSNGGSGSVVVPEDKAGSEPPGAEAEAAVAGTAFAGASENGTKKGLNRSGSTKIAPDSLSKVVSKGNTTTAGS